MSGENFRTQAQFDRVVELVKAVHLRFLARRLAAARRRLREIDSERLAQQAIARSFE